MVGCPIAVSCAAVVLAASMVSSDEPVLIATDAAFGSAMVYHIDPSTAQVLSAVDLRGTGPLGLTPLSALAFETTGALLGFTPNTDNALYRVDRDTGQATFGGRLGIVTREGGLAVAADGTIYGAGTGSPGRLFTIDAVTGRATLGPVLSLPTDISGLAARSDGLLIGLDLSTLSGPPALRTIDPATGEATLLAVLLPRIALGDVGGLEIIDIAGVETGFYIVSPDDAAAQAQLWKFDPFAGEQEPVGVIAGVGPVSGLAGIGGGCAADLDGDGEATIFDFLLLGNWFDAGDLRADIDGNGVLDVFDYLAFFNLFDLGCES